MNKSIRKTGYHALAAYFFRKHQHQQASVSCDLADLPFNLYQILETQCDSPTGCQCGVDYQIWSIEEGLKALTLGENEMVVEVVSRMMEEPKACAPTHLIAHRWGIVRDGEENHTYRISGILPEHHAKMRQLALTASERRTVVA